MIRKNYPLVIILIIASLLRFVGTNPGYNQFHSDQGITYSAATSMIKNGNLDPLRYDYPALVPLINYLFFKVIFIPLSWTKYYLTHIPEIIDGVVQIPMVPLEAKKILQVFILGEREINALFWSRYVTALFGLGNVFLTYLLTKKLFNKNTGLIAAFLLTFNYKHVVNSHLGLPDIYNAFFLLLVLLLAIKLWEKPTTRNYLLTGIAVGLSFSIKYQIFAFFPFVLVHVYVSLANAKVDFKKLFNPAFFMGVLCIPLVFLILNPYHFLYLDDVVKIVKGVSGKYGMGTKSLNLYPFSYFYHIDYGPLELVAVFIGLGIALKKFAKKTFIFLSYLAPFMFMLIYYSIGGFYIRNFITTAPMFMIFASIAIWEMVSLVNRVIGERAGWAALLIILPAIVFVPGRNAITNSYYYTKPWSYGVAAKWLKENLPKDTVVAAHPFDPPGGPKMTKTEFEIDGSFSLTEHREAGASYALINLNWAGNPFYFWMNFGIDEFKIFWNKPVSLMRNMYHGMAAEELFRYQIFSITKPWQAPDANLVLAKIPHWPEVEMSVIRTFSFEEGLEEWGIYGKVAPGPPEYKLDKDMGMKSEGSIVFLPGGTRYPGIRVTSQPIGVKPGYLYKITGFLKTDEKLTSRRREGFLRIDFYKDDPDLEKVGTISSVSSRVYGTDEWVKKEIKERAPEGSRFMTVSFQVYQANRTKIWLDDVTIGESASEITDITSEPPYIKKNIDLNLLYPDSHGNL